MASIERIRTEADYETALARIDEVLGAEHGSPEGRELDVLVDLVDLYESRHEPMGYPDPVAAIEFRMEQAGLDPRDLLPLIGSPREGLRGPVRRACDHDASGPGAPRAPRDPRRCAATPFGLPPQQAPGGTRPPPIAAQTAPVISGDGYRSVATGSKPSPDPNPLIAYLRKFVVRLADILPCRDLLRDGVAARSIAFEQPVSQPCRSPPDEQLHPHFLASAVHLFSHAAGHLYGRAADQTSEAHQHRSFDVSGKRPRMPFHYICHSVYGRRRYDPVPPEHLLARGTKESRQARLRRVGLLPCRRSISSTGLEWRGARP